MPRNLRDYKAVKMSNRSELICIFQHVRQTAKHPKPRGGGGGGWGVLPYMGYIGMCGEYGFSAVLVINRVSLLAILPPFW